MAKNNVIETEVKEENEVVIDQQNEVTVVAEPEEKITVLGVVKAIGKGFVTGAKKAAPILGSIMLGIGIGLVSGMVLQNNTTDDEAADDEYDDPIDGEATIVE